MYSYIKVPKHGAKIIRLEIYDAEKFEKSQNTMFCKCDANICMQHVVEADNMFFDDIYNAAKNLLTKIQKSMEKGL